MKKLGSPVYHMEGTTKGRWVLLDFVDFVVHVFHPTLRDFEAAVQHDLSAVVVSG